MVRVERCMDIDLLNSIFLDDARMREASLTDDELNYLQAGGNVINPNVSIYLIVYNNDNIAGLIKYEPLTSIMVSYHVYLKSAFWGTGISHELKQVLDHYFLNNTSFHKILVQTPRVCENVIKAAIREGFEIEGVLVGGIFWRGKVENLVLMSRFIRRIQ